MAADGRLNSLTVDADEHLYLVGTTGSGKTEIGRFLLRNANRTMVLDPKWEFKLESYKYRNSLPIFWRDFRIIHRPKRGQAGDVRMANLVMQAWKRKNIRIFVDELASIADFFPYTLMALSEVMRTGRSRKTTVWAATQRPRWTPRLFLSEARAIIAFPLMLEEDRKYVAGMIGPKAREELALHDFFYLHKGGGMREPVRLHFDMKRNAIVSREPIKQLEEVRL